MNWADKHQEADWWSEKSHMSSQVNYTAVNTVSIFLDSQVIVWEWSEESKWTVWKKWDSWIIKI